MQAADREHIASGIGDVEVVVDRSDGMPGTPQQTIPSQWYLPMLGRGCAIELTDAAAIVGKIHSRAT